MENAPIKANGLALRSSFGPKAEITSRIMEHYKKQLMSQIYKVFASFDMIGNPISLVETLGTGVYDLFHAPAEGIVTSPAAFGKGLAKGTWSLLNSTVYGLFNSAAKITDTVGRGLAVATFDSEYAKEREMTKVTVNTKNRQQKIMHVIVVLFPPLYRNDQRTLRTDSLLG